MPRLPPPAPSPKAVCRLFFRHRWKMAAFFLLVMGGVAAGTFLSPRSYRSQAKLFLRLGRENVTLDPTATLGQTPVVAVPANRENEINSVIDMLKSRALLEQVVAKLGPDVILGRAELPETAADQGGKPPRPAPDDHHRSPWSDDPPLPGDDRYLATVQLAKIVEVEAVKKSNVIRVSCDGPSPEVAQAIVASLVDFYLDRHVRLNRTPGAYQFLSEQTAGLRTRLTAAEEELRKVKNSTGLSSPQEQRLALVARIGRLKDELFQTEGSIAAGEATIRRLKDKLAGLPPTGVSAVTTGSGNTPGDSRRKQLDDLKLEEKRLTTRYPERHPEARRIRQQVAAAEALLKQAERDRGQVTTAPSRLYEESQIALLREEPVLAAHKARAAVLADQLAQERKRLEEFNRDQLRIARLQREVELQEALYRKYADNLEQLQIDSALASEKLSNINVVEPATFDAKPVRPRLLLNLGLGALCAVVGSVGLAVLCHRLRPGFETPEEVQQALDLPVLAAIPDLRPRQLTRNGGPRP